MLACVSRITWQSNWFLLGSVGYFLLVVKLSSKTWLYYKKLHKNYPTTVQVAFYLGRKSLAHLCNCFIAVEASLGIPKFDCCQTKIG